MILKFRLPEPCLCTWLWGKKVGVVDLTRGELGTRGTAITRDAESAEAAKILGVSFRKNLKMADGFFSNNEAHLRQIIEVIRMHKPSVVLCNAITDRHPDHGRAAALVNDACFLSGLVKIVTEVDGYKQQAHRPKAVYHYTQDRYIKPDFLVDISAHVKTKEKALRAYKTQFYDPESNETSTYISSPEFFQSIFNRNAEFGRQIGVAFAEPFTTYRCLGVSNLFDLI
jgi:bacillithiol biosynthesis deacetylase BshB1